MVRFLSRIYLHALSWKGKRALRVSVVNWRTTSDDVNRTIAAVAAALQE